MTRSLVLFALACVLVVGAGHARADASADRAAIADALVRQARHAEALARAADDSDDRAVRKHLAPHAAELGVDLQALARRLSKDGVSLAAIAQDALVIGKDAAELTELADEAADREERRSLRAQAALLERGVAEVRRAIQTLVARRDEPRKPARPAAISADSFKRLAAVIEAADFDSGKLGVVRQAAASNYFSSNQVGFVLGLLDFDDGRVEVAVAMWSRIVDPENSFVIFDKFDFEGGREKLRKRVGGR